MPEAFRPGRYYEGQWLLAKSGTDSTDWAAVGCTTFVTGGETATGLFAVMVGGGGAGGTDVNIVSPTTTVSSGAATWTAVLVRDPAGGGAAGVSTVTAHQGNSGAQAWPVQFLAAQPVNAIQSGAWPVTQGASGTQAWPVAQSGTIAVGAITVPGITITAGTVNAVQSGAWTANVNATAVVSHAVSVNNAVSIAAAQSISVAITGTQTVSVSGTANVSVAGTANVSVAGTANVSLAGQPIAVQPRVTGTPTVFSFSMATSGSTTVGASTAGSRYLVHAYGVFNGDTITHAFALLESNNTTRIPAYLAANGGGHNIAYPNPLPFATNAAINLSVIGAIGTNAVVGYIEFQQVPN